MWLLLVGLGLFFVAHLVPTRPDLRARLVARFGAGRYSGLFSVVSLVALAMIVWGYGRMQGLARQPASVGSTSMEQACDHAPHGSGSDLVGCGLCALAHPERNRSSDADSHHVVGLGPPPR
jgi:NnrU protein